jgi:hypothetical protein
MLGRLVYIVGNKGNMGRRYGAILDYLGVPHTGHDRAKEGRTVFRSDYKKATHFIIATPTDRHIDDIKFLLKLQLNKPILCEKPLSLDLGSILDLERFIKEDAALVSMVNQYKYMADEACVGVTCYDYFKTGNDGLAWDCINIIGLAKTKPLYIKNESPIWRASINGKKLSLSMVDEAYVAMIKDFLSREYVCNWAYSVKAHEKVIEWLKS